jgi:pyrroloquinoline quinone biosynthesis protein D
METPPSPGQPRVTHDSVPRVHPEAALTRVGGQWMAATLDARLHTFEGPEGVSEVGERIVELVNGERSVRAIAMVLVEEFEVSSAVAEADTVEFIGQLVERQVLTV